MATLATLFSWRTRQTASARCTADPKRDAATITLRQCAVDHLDQCAALHLLSRTQLENVRQRIVTERGYKDLRVVAEHIAEFEHQPSRASRSYRMVVLRKEIEAYQGEKRLFAEYRYFAYITNDTSRSTQDVVFFANKRADQEKLIGTLKSEVRSLRAPVDGLVSNWA